MVDYKKTYFNHFGLGLDDVCYCEICYFEGRSHRMNWVHHINAKGMGGTKKKYTIEELQGICYNCDVKYGDRTDHKEYLQNIHNQFLINNPY